MNDETGKPCKVDRGTSINAPTGQGQLVYYFQAVDRFAHHADKEQHLQALKFVNLSKSNGLMGVFGCYVGASSVSPRLVQGFLFPMDSIPCLE